LLCLEASLRRDSRHFPEALDILDRALASAPPDARGRILVNRAFVLNQCGEPAEALRTLSRAEPLIDEPIEPRLRYVLRFNQAVSLIELGRAEEAASLISDLQRRAETLGNKLDLLRTLWVSSRVDAALGREEYALASLERVVREFSDLNLGWDAALASLELVALRLKRGEQQAAQVLAEAMAWIFAEKGVGSECVAAVALFREAARREEASVAMARNAWLVVKQALSLPLPLDGA
jgi:tetratricopeptide (TPR) repeat protein